MNPSGVPARSGTTPTRTAPTVSRGWMQLILDAAARAGVDRASVAAAAGIPASAWDAARCPLPVCIATWETAACLSGDAHFGLSAGLTLRALHVNLLTHALAGSRTLGEALVRAQRYLPLVSDGGTVAMHLTDDELEIRYIPLSHGWQYSHHQIDAALLAIRRTLGSLLAELPEAETTPRRVNLRHPLSAPGLYRRAFACPVRGKQPHDGLVYPASLLALPTGGDAVSQARAAARAERLLAGLREHALSARCERLLAATLADGDVSRARIAAQLSLSERTLQRRLAAEGHDFQTLLARLRQDLACEYLAAGLSAAQTARLLGYSEPAAFHRAFIVWLGITPGVFARQLRAGASAAAR